MTDTLVAPEQLRDLSADDKRQLLARVRGEVLRRSAEDGWFWTQFVQTRDESDPNNAVKPFPRHLPYVKELWRLLETEQRLVVAKSRQLFMSWLVCTFLVWWARFKPNQYCVLQTQKHEDAVKMVAMPGSSEHGGYTGRCQFLEYRLPAWMRQPVVTAEGRITYPNGSMIEALAGGADQIRGKTASVIVLDEAAFLAEAKATYTAVAPLVQKGAKFIGVSTPNGSDGNFFWHLWSGVPYDA